MPLQESFLGTTGAVGFPWPNAGWALADGSSIPLSQNEALFAVLGTTYGGDGVSSFSLPDLRGRHPYGQGAGPNRTPAIMGSWSGREMTSLLLAQMPPHEHPVALGGSAGAAGAGMAEGGSGAVQPMPTGVTGEGRPFPLGPPTVVHSFIVCITGLFPVPNDW